MKPAVPFIHAEAYFDHARQRIDDLRADAERGRKHLANEARPRCDEQSSDRNGSSDGDRPAAETPVGGRAA